MSDYYVPPDEYSGITTYPVGLFDDARRGRRYLRRCLRHYLWPCIKRRDWHLVRTYLNGYLAEWDYPPAGMVIHRCGHGWTRRAALRRLGREIVSANMNRNER